MAGNVVGDDSPAPLLDPLDVVAVGDEWVEARAVVERAPGDGLERDVAVAHAGAALGAQEARGEDACDWEMHGRYIGGQMHALSTR